MKLYKRAQQCSHGLFLFPLDILYNLQSVEQIISETLESDCHSYYDAEYDVGSTDVEKNNLMKPENDTGSGKGILLPGKYLQHFSTKKVAVFYLILLPITFPLSFSFQLITGGG